MDIKDYKFNVGDKVITTEGEVGEIISVCNCSSCIECGFLEPTWISYIDGSNNYITISNAVCGFQDYYQIGEYRFNGFNREVVSSDIISCEKKLIQLKKQLKVIDGDCLPLILDCDSCKNGTYRKSVHQWDGTFVRKVNFCDECGRDLRDL